MKLIVYRRKETNYIINVQRVDHYAGKTDEEVENAVKGYSSRDYSCELVEIPSEYDDLMDYFTEGKN